MNPKGLSEDQALKLLKEHGPNVIQNASKVRPLKIFLEQLKSPLIFILIVAAVISIVLGERSDAVFILLVVAINTLLGFSQEYKAENTLEKLKQSVSKNVRVIREGTQITIDTKYLVPGDIFILEPGLRIPADADLFEVNEILVNESVLTGEAEPVSKDTADQKNIFMGTLVLEGIGKAIVTATGSNTKFGEIAQSLSEDTNPPTPINLELKNLSRIITIFILFIILIIFILGITIGIDFKEIFLVSVALGVSTIPEGLIISLTITLALGMNRLLSKKALVKNLPAAETLGDVEVLCIDKTGTLTQGNMLLKDIDFTDKDAALRALAISNNQTNFIDKAVLKYLEDVTPKDFIAKTQLSRKKLFPFTSERKYTGASDGEMLYAVGAPEVIFNFSKGDLTSWQSKYIEKGRQGNRMLAVAQKKATNSSSRESFKDMEFLGLVYIKDPIRENVKESLGSIVNAGIRIKVITGDLKETAVSVLENLGLQISHDEMVSGEELEEIIASEKLGSVIEKIKLFYRTTPNQKLSIVKALQEKNLIVGMMGDGVNDSPALKVAEIGLVVDNATDVSKEVADIILLDSNFETIEEAVAEGRNIIQNLRKILTFLLADSLTETVLILLSIIFLLPLPLTPILLLWINIIEDGLPSLALAFENSNKSDLLRKPVSKRKSLLDRKVVSIIIATSLVKDIIFFAIYFLLINNGYDLVHAQTFIFACISLSSLLFLFSAKTIDHNIWSAPLFDNKMVNLSFVFGVFLLFLSIYWLPISNLLGTTALNSMEIFQIVVLSGLSLAFIEIAKFIIHRVFPSN